MYNISNGTYRKRPIYGLADKIIIEEYEGQKIDDIQHYNVDIFYCLALIGLVILTI